MTTITSKFTKERLIDWAVVAVAERGRDLKDAPESVEAAANLKLAEIALAALTAEPVRYLNKFSGTCVTLEQQSNAADDVAVYIPLYAAPPASVTGIYDDVLNIIGLLENNEWAEHCTSTVLGSLLESEITRLVSKEQSVPVVPEEIEPDSNNTYDYVDGWSACRAAMLQGGEPVSQTYELPQTQLEQVADLYEMQFDDGRTCAFHTDGAKAAQWLLACDGNKVQEYVRIERYQEAVIGNSPIIPDGYALVPVEPTRQMMAQGHFAMKGTDRGKFRRIYQAMITAAPALNKGGINAE